LTSVYQNDLHFHFEQKMKHDFNYVPKHYRNVFKQSLSQGMIIFVKFLTIPAIYIIIKSLIIVGLLNQTIDFYGSIRKTYVQVI